MSLKYSLKKDNDTKTYIYLNTENGKNLDDIQSLLENNDDVVIESNSETVNTINSYKNVTDYIYRIITNSRFLCKGLNPEYIKDSFHHVDAVLIIGSSMNVLPNGNIYGFALIVFDETKNAIYIDVICSHIGIKSAGDTLIKAVESISKQLLMSKIYLTSVESAIPFYEKYGFIKKDASCYDMCLMTKLLNKNYGGKNSKKMKIIKTRKNKNKNKKRNTKKRL